MRSIPVHPGLTHRLLVAAARAHHDSSPPLDWDELLAATGTAATPRSVQRALLHLADRGYIQGISTPSGWLSVRVTDRGIRRAGRAARRPVRGASAVATTEAGDGAPSSSRPTTVATAAVSRYRDADTAAQRLLSAGGHRLRADVIRRTATAFARTRGFAGQTLSPAVLNLRTSLAQAWHLFTTFP